MLNIFFKKVKEEAIIPKKGIVGSAGWDLFTLVGFTLHPNERKTIMIGIAGKAKIINNFAEEFDYWVEFKGCSGNAHKHGLEILGGVIDENFRGEWGVILLNTGDHNITFNIGDKLAQAIFIPHFKVENIFLVTELDDTTRGKNGFGSTGIAGI